MWNRSSENPNKADDDVPSKRSRRNEEEQYFARNPYGSVNSSNSKKKSSSSRSDDRDRGFNPTSTSYSSTSRSPYPNTAGASIASSYATASGNNDAEPYAPPGLVRNASLADKVPKSNSSRGERDLNGEQERKTQRRKERSTNKEEKTDPRDRPRSRDRGENLKKMDKRERKDRERAQDWRVNKFAEGVDVEDETSRGPAEFSNQVESAEFMQFPGQYDAGVTDSNGGPAGQTAAMSSHVQDQFPGQFPLQTSAPYRPPMAASEGGPGLAAEYYGDAGQSVAEQPGYRIHSPSLIVGAEPHLQPASSVAAPPPEPSASGGVGAAASFFSGSFISDEAESSHGQQNSPSQTSAPSRPHNDENSTSASTLPALGGVAMGAAAGYVMGNQSSSYQQRPENLSSVGASNEAGPSSLHGPQSQPQDSHISNETRPPRPEKPSSQSSSIPIYAASTAGAAGLAAAAYYNSHHPSQHNPTAQHYPSTPIKHRHRHHGPLGAFVDFFKDPEGVARFEEYTEFIGVCKYCFAPGSSPRDAPRKHHYRRRRSNERYGSSTRVDKDSRYSSSENEGRRKKDNSWLATGLAGYGLAKVGESLFKQKKDFDDTYSVKTSHSDSAGRKNKYRRSFETKTSREGRLNERTETGISGNGKTFEGLPLGGAFGGPTTTTYATWHHPNSRPRSRSASRHRKSRFAEAAAGAAISTSAAASGLRRRSSSPNGFSLRTKHKSRGDSPERRTTSHKKKKDRGFFSFGSASSSSSSLALVYSSSQDRHRSKKVAKYKDKDDRRAEAALLGLGAAAAALASKNGRSGQKTKGIKDLVAVKETKEKDRRGSRHNTSFKKPSVSLEEEVWESASEGEFSILDSDLAFGDPAHRVSRESFHSDSSGTKKWGWRWGSKKNGKENPSRRLFSEDSSIPDGTGAALAGAGTISPDQYSGNRVEDSSGLPLQYVYPMPTSDPGRFDVGPDPSIASSSRPVLVSSPENVPIQHPQPINPVSSALYPSQAPYSQSFSAPSGPPVFSQPSFQSQASVSSERRNLPEAGDSARDFKLRRRETSPARFGVDAAMGTKVSRRRASTATKDDSSAVRLAFTGEQEEEDRREKKRMREGSLLRERERRAEVDKVCAPADRQRSKEESSRNFDTMKLRDDNSKRSSETSWALSAATGLAGAAIGAGAMTERPKNDESREERRERRRRERTLDEEEHSNEIRERRRRQRDHNGDRSDRRSEGRRKECDRDEEDAKNGDRQAPPENFPEPHDTSERQTRPVKKDDSARQEAAFAKRSSSHENYETFFTPLEFLQTSNDQVKVTSANADADIDLGQSPDVITVEPKRYRDLSTSPSYSPANTDGKLSFPWQVPKLRLVEPTPPSSRGSTPVIKPRDTYEEDDAPSSKETTSSKVTWGDNQTHEYTVITPQEHRDEFIESSYKKSTLEKDPVDESDNENDQQMRNPPNRPTSTEAEEPNEPSASYGDDYEFAAALAAGAENAGFDPSIVLNDPSFRRRDSPPASQEGTMPGEFDDEDEPKLSKKDKKKRDKATRRQSQPKLSEVRDEDAVVQDIISQVENTEPRGHKDDDAEDFSEEWQSGRKSKSKKPKASRKRSDFNEDNATPETARADHDLESRVVYESPTEDAVSVAGSAATSADIEDGKKTRSKAKRDSSSFDKASSSVSSPSTTNAGRDTKSKAKKGSLWDRVLGKSTDNPSQGTKSRNGASEAKDEDYDGMMRKGRKSKDRESRRESEDNSYDAASTSSQHDDKEKKRRSSEDSAAQDTGRITQDLPDKDRESSRSNFPPAGSVAQYLDEGSESEQTQQKASESFLWMRPEPPRPPDIPAESREALISASKEHSITDASPTHSLSEFRRQRPSEVQLSDLPHSPKASPSPTAIPVHFRRPIPSSGSPRSLSQTALSSAPSTASPSRQKSRPRSTEFKSSTEFRPLWLVERHRSQQSPAPEESYPSLPSSHTSSRASSVRDLEEHGANRVETRETTGRSGELTGEDLGLLINTVPGDSQSPLLDSQQATPTAITFQHLSSAQESQYPSSSGHIPSRQSTEIGSQPLSMNFQDATIGAVTGGAAAYAVSNADRPYGATTRDSFQGEHGLDDMGQKSSSLQSQENGLALEGEDNFAFQNTNEGEKAKHDPSKADQARATFMLPTSEIVEQSPGSTGLEPLAPEMVRRIQEQDVQDTADSWSMPDASPSTSTKMQRTLIGAEPLKERELSLETPREKERSKESSEESESKDEIGNVATVAVEDQNTLADSASLPTATEDREDFGSLLQRRESKSKGKSVRKSWKNLNDDEDVEPASTVSTNLTGHITEPQDANFTDGQGKDITVTDSAFSNVGSTISGARELSPKAAPLPVDGDLDSIDTPQNEPFTETEEVLIRDGLKRDEAATDVLYKSPKQSTSMISERKEPDSEDPDEFFTKQSKKKGKKGKKARQSVSNEPLGQLASNEESAPIPAAESNIAEGQLRIAREESPVVVHLEKAGEVEEEFAGFSKKKTAKKGKKQKAAVFHFEKDDTKEVHLGHDIDVDKDDRDLPSSQKSRDIESTNTSPLPPDVAHNQIQNESVSASASASQDVQAILSTDASQNFPGETSDEKVASPSITDRVLREEPKSDQSAKRSDEERLKFSANNDRTVSRDAPNVDSFQPSTDIIEDPLSFEPGTADTNTASAVEEILEGPQRATDSTDPEIEGKSATSAVDNATLNKPAERDDMDWAAPKREKKGKKSRKGEGFSFDDSEPVENVNRHFSSAQVDTVIRQESDDEAADDLLPKKPDKDKTGDQKPLSRLVPDHQYAAETNATTTEGLKPVGSRSGIVQEPSFTPPATDIDAAEDRLEENSNSSEVTVIDAIKGTAEILHAAELADEDSIAQKSKRDKKKVKKSKGLELDEELLPTPEDEPVSSMDSLVARNAMETDAKMLDSLKTTESVDIVDETRGLKVEPAKDSVQQMSKKERKKAKKGKLPTWGEDSALLSTEEHMQAAESNKSAPETKAKPKTPGSGDIELAEDIMLGETARRVEPSTSKDLAPPTSKKDKKKAKKSRASTWDDDDAPLPNSEPMTETRDTDQNPREQAPPKYGLAVEQEDGVAEDRQKKKGKKKAKKTQPSSWDNDDASTAVEIGNNKRSTDAGTVTLVPEPANESSRDILLNDYADFGLAASVPEGDTEELLSSKADFAQETIVQDEEIHSSTKTQLKANSSGEPEASAAHSQKKNKKEKKKAKKLQSIPWDESTAEKIEIGAAASSQDTNLDISAEHSDLAAEPTLSSANVTREVVNQQIYEPDEKPSAPSLPAPEIHKTGEEQIKHELGAYERVPDPQYVHDVPNSAEPNEEMWSGPVEETQENRKSVQSAAENPEINERTPSGAPGYAQGVKEKLRDSQLDTKMNTIDEETPPTNTPGSAASFDLLDPQEQRQYNEEYQKELERQLSPLHGEAQGSIMHNQTPYPATSVPNVGELVDRPREEAEETLPPLNVLEDIVEEQPSGSGSLEEAVADEENNPLPFKTIKKVKKGKKGKKQQQQPVIWEDDTATQGLSHDTSELTGAPPHMHHPLLENEEPVEQDPPDFEGLQTRDNSAVDQFRTPYGEAVDYFGIYPSVAAEKDVGRSEENSLRHSMSIERSSMARDGQADSEPRRDQNVARHEGKVEHSTSEEMGESGGLHDRTISRSDSIEARHPEKNDWDAAPVEKSNNGKQYNARVSESELGATESAMQDPQGLVSHRDSPQGHSYDAMAVPYLSPQRALNSHVQHNESSVSKDPDVSNSKSTSMEGLVVAASLGAGVAAAKILPKKYSKEEKRKDRKSRKSKRQTESIEANDSDREDMPHNDLEQSHSKEESAAEAQKEFQNTPPRSPEHYTDFARSIEDQSDHDLSQRPESSQQRDSAIHVSDPPVTYDPVPVPESNQRDWSVTPDPLNLPMESDPNYELSVSMSRSNRRRARRTSGAAYDSDDSADSGFDIQRRRRLQAMAGEQREPSPVSSTTKDRSSWLFDSSPSARNEDQLQALRALSEDGLVDDEAKATSGGDTQNEPYERNDSLEEDIVHRHADGPGESRRSLFGGPISEDDDSITSTSRSPAMNESHDRRLLDTISEAGFGRSPRHGKDKRESTDVGSPEPGIKARRTSRRQASSSRGPEDNAQRYVSTEDLVSRLYRPTDGADKHSAPAERSRSRDRLSSRQSNASSLHRDAEQRPAGIGSPDSIHAIIRTPDQFRTASGQSFRSATPPSLRRVDWSASSDLRGASKQSQTKSRAKIPEAEADLGIASSSTYDPLTDKGKNRPDMADVYEGWGDVRGQSPMSPTRPPSMRKRQSLHFADLEQRLEQLASDHRSLQNAKSVADRRLDQQTRDHDQQRRTYEEAIQEHKTYLAEKDLELSKLHEVLEGFKNQVADLTEVNEELSSSRRLREHDSNYAGLEAEHHSTHQQWQQATRDLGDLREQHTRLANDHADIVEREVEGVRQEKDYELQQLRGDLESAKEQVRQLQQQILSSSSNEGFIERDEDYFDGQCQKLCQQVQQWVLRFSKFSDMQACRSTDTVSDAAAERWDDAILDGSEVDDYLQDRVKRRDVFMSVVMSMMFEFIFTRYLFGMDRLQRKKLKDLQNTLEEIGPMSAVHKWRAITLALLSKRPEFQEQLAADTEGVVQRIFDVLSAVLPPPKHLVDQIQNSLHKVVTMAADLSIEMRTQRAEYSMLPPLKPEFDSAGAVVSKVEFKAITMNERSGTTSSNEALEEQRAAVRMVLFPLVVKRTDDDEQIIVCPAQVLTAAGSKGKKTVRVTSAQGSRSVASFAGTEDTRMEGGMF